MRDAPPPPPPPRPPPSPPPTKLGPPSSPANFLPEPPSPSTSPKATPLPLCPSPTVPNPSHGSISKLQPSRRSKFTNKTAQPLPTCQDFAHIQFVVELDSNEVLIDQPDPWLIITA